MGTLHYRWEHSVLKMSTSIVKDIWLWDNISKYKLYLKLSLKQCKVPSENNN